jgi:acyl carrier protein
MRMEQEVIDILEDVLGIDARDAHLSRDSALLGAVPELDSSSVVALLTAIEERFGISIHDDELEVSSFATVGTLTDFIGDKVKVTA